MQTALCLILLISFGAGFPNNPSKKSSPYMDLNTSTSRLIPTPTLYMA